MPIVSIITALHNKGPYLAETAASVRAQSLKDWEMLIVENGSSDEGPRIAAALAAQEPRIRLLRSPAIGPGAARNHGLKHAQGDWLLFLDADDLIEPDYLKARLHALGQQPNAHIIAGPWVAFPDGHPDQRTTQWPSAWHCGANELMDSAIGASPWALHAALVRREWLTGWRVWQERHDAHASEDNIFWFRVLHEAIIAWSDSPGAVYRISTTNSRDLTATIDERATMLETITRHHLDFLRERDLDLTTAQALNLMRTWERIHYQASAAHAPQTAETALRQSEHWLRSSGSFQPAVLVRRLLGVRRFLALRRSLNPRGHTP
jgi:glycosyltransferase involved in cell wall biosynthesis